MYRRAGRQENARVAPAHFALADASSHPRFTERGPIQGEEPWPRQPCLTRTCARRSCSREARTSCGIPRRQADDRLGNGTP